jgi:multidrug efflux pump subunit AcrB
LGDWLRTRLRAEGLKLSFEPAEIVNEVMSFGSPTPVEIAVSGPKFADNRAYAEKVRQQLQEILSLRDLQFAQSLDYPAVAVEVDRERAGLSGVTAGRNEPRSSAR